MLAVLLQHSILCGTIINLIHVRNFYWWEAAYWITESTSRVFSHWENGKVHKETFGSFIWVIPLTHAFCIGFAYWPRKASPGVNLSLSFLAKLQEMEGNTGADRARLWHWQYWIMNCCYKISPTKAPKNAFQYPFFMKAIPETTWKKTWINQPIGWMILFLTPYQGLPIFLTSRQNVCPGHFRWVR